MSSFIPKLLLFYMFTSGSLTLTQKKSNKLQLGERNECRRCRLVTDSFSNWFDKTSRGKHEGGDAAWEEAKLKSYARSEMRLVEIQERLCSELKTSQDDCYNLLEEADQKLEKWWFHEDQNPSDLYNWLCIDNLKYCCPVNHYGDMCTPCPRDKNNKICGGNGKCNGDGTRKGDGTCICKKGYKGISCEECKENFFNSNSSCKPCHQACVGCHGDGVRSCINCAMGWVMEAGACVDLNECLETSTCKINEYCTNKDGYYLCNPCDKICASCSGSSPSSCTSCHPSHILLIGKCVNIEFKIGILKDAYLRIVMYLVLVALALYKFKKSKIFASFIVLIVSVLIYYFEKMS